MLKELTNNPIELAPKAAEVRRMETRIRLGEVMPQRGHRIWAVTVATLAVEEATIVERLDGTKGIDVQEGVVYLSALNAGNAVRKIQKVINQS